MKLVSALLELCEKMKPGFEKLIKKLINLNLQNVVWNLNLQNVVWGKSNILEITVTV